MRYKEIQDGIEIRDIDGNKYGKSIKAGKMAIGQTVISRVMVPFIVMFIPSFIMCKVYTTSWDLILSIDQVRTRFRMSKMYLTMFEVSI